MPFETKSKNAGPAPALPKHGERNVATPVTTALKAAVYIAMREQVVSKRG